MKQRRGFQIAVTAGCVLFLLGTILPMYHLDLSAITGRLGDVFSDLDFFSNGKDVNFFKMVGKLKDIKEGGASLIGLYITTILLPFLLIIATGILVWLNKKATDIASAVCSALTVVFMPLMHLIVLPVRIKDYVDEITDSAFDGTILDVFSSKISEEVGEQLADVYRDSLSWGFYVPLVISVLVLVFAILLLRCKTTAAPVNYVVGKRTGHEPGIRDLAGIFGNADLPIRAGETLFVGRNPDECSIIVKGNLISRKHCSISFNDMSGQYTVTDFSSNGTYIIGQGKMLRNRPMMVPRGTRLALGEKDKEFFQLL